MLTKVTVWVPVMVRLLALKSVLKKEQLMVVEKVLLKVPM